MKKHTKKSSEKENLEEKFFPQNDYNIKILNPTMKEIKKLEDNMIEEQEVMGKIINKKEDNANKDNKSNSENSKKPLLRVHRLSVRKKEIGKMRSKLISSSIKKEEYIDEVEMNKALAEKMAINIFKKRLKYISKYINLDDGNKINKNDFISFKPINHQNSDNLIFKNTKKIDFLEEKNQYNGKNHNKILKVEMKVESSRNKYKNNGMKIDDNIDNFNKKVNKIKRFSTDMNFNSGKFRNIDFNKSENKIRNLKEYNKININKNEFRNENKIDIRQIEIKENINKINLKDNNNLTINIDDSNKRTLKNIYTYNSKSNLNTTNLRINSSMHKNNSLKINKILINTNINEKEKEKGNKTSRINRNSYFINNNQLKVEAITNNKSNLEDIKNLKKGFITNTRKNDYKDINKNQVNKKGVKKNEIIFQRNQKIDNKRVKTEENNNSKYKRRNEKKEKINIEENKKIMVNNNNIISNRRKLIIN